MNASSRSKIALASALAALVTTANAAEEATPADTDLQ